MGVLTEDFQKPGDVPAPRDLFCRFDADQLLQGGIASQLSQTGFEVPMPQDDGQDDHSPEHGDGVVIASAATPRTQSFQQWFVGDALEQPLDGAQRGMIFQAIPGEERLLDGDSHA